jgi:hypothetical protein
MIKQAIVAASGVSKRPALSPNVKAMSSPALCAKRSGQSLVGEDEDDDRVNADISNGHGYCDEHSMHIDYVMTPTEDGRSCINAVDHSNPPSKMRRTHSQSWTKKEHSEVAVVPLGTVPVGFTMEQSILPFVETGMDAFKRISPLLLLLL